MNYSWGAWRGSYTPPYPEESYSTSEKWVEEQQDMVDKAGVMIQRVRE